MPPRARWIEFLPDAEPGHNVNAGVLLVEARGVTAQSARQNARNHGDGMLKDFLDRATATVCPAPTTKTLQPVISATQDLSITRVGERAFVAYVALHWSAVFACRPPDKDAEPEPFDAERPPLLQALGFSLGRRRCELSRFPGAVVAMAVGPTRQEANQGARNAARIHAHLRTTLSFLLEGCPGKACRMASVGFAPVEEHLLRVERRLRGQWVAFAAAIWKVTFDCRPTEGEPPPPGKKKGKRKSKKKRGSPPSKAPTPEATAELERELERVLRESRQGRPPRPRRKA